ncbi:MAG: diguanylate cyclase [Chloroflexota bacterium]|nr:diguanylate cyclase [Chloroflexota bacterium]
MQRLVSNPGLSQPRRSQLGITGRLHVTVFAGGLLVLILGLVGWAFGGGPASVVDLIIVLDLTIGGTLLCTGALVGRARAAETRRDAQLRVLQLAARRMSASLTPEAVGCAVVEEMRSVIDYHNARVYLLEPPDDLVPIAFVGRVGAYEKVDLEILRTKVGQGLTGWVAKHGMAIRADDAGRDPRGMTIPGTDDVDESMLVVPMQHDDGLVGVITLSKLGLRQFDDDDLRLLTILADQAATAFSGAALMSQTRRLATELRQLLDLSSGLSRSLDPHDVANLIAEHLLLAFGAEQAVISDWDQQNDRVRTLGSYPVSLRGTVEPFYPLAQYPLTRRVLDEGVIVVVDAEDPEVDAAEAEILRADGMGGLVMLPLIAKGEAIGLVELVSRGRPINEAGRITLARTMAHEAAMALENARMYETARNLADRDPLTGFVNHRYLHERLSEEIVRAVRNRQPLSVLMLDLDDFKLVNDTFGHVYGDRVLVHVAEQVRSTLRASDVGGRYGGDEFAVILPETGRDGAVRAAERILESLRASPFAAEGRRPFPVGASIGISTHPTDGRTATDLVAVADLGLYAAKHAGGGIALPGGRPADPADPVPSGSANARRPPLPAGGMGPVAGRVRSGTA